MGVGACSISDRCRTFKDSTEQTGGAFQGGLGLPDRDYYTKTDDTSVKLRDAYQAHLVENVWIDGRFRQPLKRGSRNGDDD